MLSKRKKNQIPQSCLDQLLFAERFPWLPLASRLGFHQEGAAAGWTEPPPKEQMWSGGCWSPGTWVFIPGFAALSVKLGKFPLLYLSPGGQLAKWDRDPRGLLQPKSLRSPKLRLGRRGMRGHWPAQAFAKQMRHVSCNLGCSVSQLPKGVERPV